MVRSWERQNVNEEGRVGPTKETLPTHFAHPKQTVWFHYVQVQTVKFGVSCVSRRRCLVSVHLRVGSCACTGQQPSSWLACASASVVVCVVRVGTCTLRGGAGRQGGIQGMRTPQSLSATV